MTSKILTPELGFPGSEALAATASLALSNSDKLCHDSCREYHALWGFLRLYGNNLGVTNDDAFLIEVLGNLVASGARRVLVCGSADHGLLAYVLNAFADTGEIPDITVLDLCQTPLATCRWYANRLGYYVDTVATDALSFDDAPFDLIVAHNFLNFFPKEDRRRLASRWYALLAPGGAVVSVSSIKPGALETSRRIGPSQVEFTVERMIAGRNASGHFELIDADRLAELIHDFSAKRISHNLRDAAEVQNPFDFAGFDVDLRSISSPLDVDSAIALRKDRFGVLATRPKTPST